MIWAFDDIVQTGHKVCQLVSIVYTVICFYSQYYVLILQKLFELIVHEFFRFLGHYST